MYLDHLRLYLYQLFCVFVFLSLVLSRRLLDCQLVNKQKKIPEEKTDVCFLSRCDLLGPAGESLMAKTRRVGRQGATQFTCLATQTKSRVVTVTLTQESLPAFPFDYDHCRCRTSVARTVQ